jgi:hypothetical protein
VNAGHRTTARSSSTVLSIFLAKEEVQSIDELLDDRREPVRTTLTAGGIKATLFTSSTHRILRATLNSVPIDRIRSIDKKAFEGISTHTREQASKDTSIGDFGIDVERDILRAVVGTPDDPSLGTRLAGMNSLTTTCRVTLETLPELLARYLESSTLFAYKSRLSWIENVMEVRDRKLRARRTSRPSITPRAPRRPNTTRFLLLPSTGRAASTRNSFITAAGRAASSSVTFTRPTES